MDLATCAVLAAAAAGSPTAEALEAGWRGRVAPAMGSWRNVLQRWRFSRRYQGKRLTRAGLRVEVEPGRVPDCPRCDGACCRGPNLVSLRLVDLARLVDAGLGWAAVPARAAARAEVYAAHPELRGLERLDSFRSFPVLAQRRDHCVFIGPDQRCAIYPLRPLACRRFPYLLAPDLEGVRYAAGCPRSRRDAGPLGAGSDAEALLSSVLEHHEQKLRDLAWLTWGREELDGLGLGEYLPGARAARAFAAFLR